MRPALFALAVALGALPAGVGMTQPSATDVGQIAAPAGAAAVSVGQIGGRDSAAAPDQISASTEAVQAAAAAPLASADVTSPRVGGRDRCDPAAGREAVSAECRRILSQHTSPSPPQPAAGATPTIVDPDTSSSDLVNGIVNSGTGTLVQLPPN